MSIPIKLKIVLGLCLLSLPCFGQIINPGAGSLPSTQLANSLKCNDTSITANTITCSPVTPATAYTDGMLLLVKVANTNTGATTINVSSLGPKNVTESGGNVVALNGGELLGGSPYILQYDGTQFQMLDSAVIDCSADPGVTLDAKIANGIAASTTSKAVVIDCRNVGGTPQIAANPFAAQMGTGNTGGTAGYVLMPLQQVNFNAPMVIPSGWQVIGNAAQFASGSNGTYIKAGAQLPAKYVTGTISTTSCAAGPPITCTITGSGTTWNTASAVKLGEHFTLCATSGGVSGGGFCTTSATNAVDGRISAINSDTSLTITSVTNSTSNGAGAYNYVIWSPMIEMGDEAASAAQPANFGVQIGGLKVDCNGVSGCIPVYVRSCQNLCGFNGPIYVNPADSIGFALMGNQMQNSGPWFPFWSVCQAGKCTSTSIGVLVRGATAVPINLDGWSSAADAVAGATPIAIDSPVFLRDAHILVAGAADGVSFGNNIACPIICDIPGLAVTAGGVENLNCAGGGTGACLHIGNNSSPINFFAQGIKAPLSAGFTNTFKDDVRGCTIPNATETTVGLYVVGQTTSSYFSTSSVAGCSGVGSVGGLSSGTQNTAQGIGTFSGSAANPGAVTICIAGASCNGTTLAPGANAGAITVNLPTLNAANLVYTTVTLGAGSLVLGQGLQRTQATNNLVSSDGAKITTYNSIATAGIGLEAVYASVSNTAQTAAIGTTTLCAAATCGNGAAGVYHVKFDLWGSGTACSSVTAGKVTFLLTWTDENAVNHAAVAVQMTSQTGAATTATQDNMPFQTALANEGSGGNFTISTNGTIIQYATGYTACTTGTGTYNVRAVVTRVQ